MSDPLHLDEFQTSRGDCWSVDAPLFGENRLRYAMALGADAFYFNNYLFQGSLQKATEKMRDGSECAEALGKGTKVISLRDICAVEKVDLTKTFEVQYLVDGRRKRLAIPSPGCELYARVFEMLHHRVGPELPVVTQQARMRQVVLRPCVAIGLAALIGFLIFAAAMVAADGAEPHVTGRRAGIKAAIYAVGVALGPIGATVVWVGLVAAASIWLVVRLRNRAPRQVVEVR